MLQTSPVGSAGKSLESGVLNFSAGLPMQDSSMLGVQVPTPEHFKTKVARVLFDMGDAQGRLPLAAQNTLRNAVSRLLVLALRGSAAWLPLLRRTDRLVMAHCAGSIKREVLLEICARAPHLLSSMPQSRHHVQALSRALFLSSVLHPAALKRIEEAVRAEAQSTSN